LERAHGKGYRAADGAIADLDGDSRPDIAA
jgi:hypothetical protein